MTDATDTPLAADPPLRHAPDGDLGRFAYEAYVHSVGGVSVGGDPLPTWAQLCMRRPDVATAWIAAAKAVVSAVFTGKEPAAVTVVDGDQPQPYALHNARGWLNRASDVLTASEDHMSATEYAHTAAVIGAGFAHLAEIELRGPLPKLLRFADSSGEVDHQ